MAPVAPISSDGHSVGAEPTVTWKPGRDSRIICITFSMFPELSLMPMIFGWCESSTTAAAGISSAVVHDPSYAGKFAARLALARMGDVEVLQYYACRSLTVDVSQVEDLMRQDLEIGRAHV